MNAMMKIFCQVNIIVTKKYEEITDLNGFAKNEEEINEILKEKLSKMVDCGLFTIEECERVREFIERATKEARDKRKSQLIEAGRNNYIF